MLNKDEELIFIDILDCLDTQCIFGPGLNEETFFDYIVYPLRDCPKLAGFSWTALNGASKGVLIFDELDYVIKIPFYGIAGMLESRWSSKKSNEENEETEYESIYDDYVIESFYGNTAICDECKNSWDYCEAEAILYKKAKKDGINKYFAETFLIGSADEWPIYAQKKAVVYCESKNYKQYSKEEITKTYDYCDSQGYDLDRLDPNWIIDFFNAYGKEKFDQFINFCETYDINDLHDGNVGYIDNLPCLIDYSGYSG